MTEPAQESADEKGESDHEPDRPPAPVDEATLAAQKLQRKQAGFLVLLGVVGAGLPRILPPRAPQSIVALEIGERLL